MENNIRNSKEEIVKKKLGSEDIDLSNVKDEDLDKAITDDDKKNLIKDETQTKDLNLDNLKDDQLDNLLGHLNFEDKGSSLAESIDDAVAYMIKDGYEDKTICDVLENYVQIKSDEAKKICKDIADSLGVDLDVEKTVVDIDDKKSEDTPHIDDLEKSEGEKVKKPDLPKVEYGYEKEAKKEPEAEDISTKKEESTLKSKIKTLKEGKDEVIHYYYKDEEISGEDAEKLLGLKTLNDYINEAQTMYMIDPERSEKNGVRWNDFAIRIE